MGDAIGVSIETLLVDAYQDLQDKYEVFGSNKKYDYSEKLYFNINNVSDFLEKESVYILSGSTPVKNKEMLRDVTCSIIQDNAKDTKALVVLLTTEIEEWTLQMLSCFSSVSMIKLESGAFSSGDWRKVANATTHMGEADISVVSLADESELFRDAGDFLKGGNSYDYIFIDLVDGNASNRVKLKQLAQDFNITIVSASRAFDGLDFPEISKLI